MYRRPRPPLFRARTLWLLPALACVLLTASPAEARRALPVGIYNVNNSALSQGSSRIYAMRFVLDRPARIERFYSGMNWEGVYVDDLNQPAPAEIRSGALNKGYPSPAPPANLPAGWTPGTGRLHYAHGTGGTIRARLVPMRADGTPDLSRVLAEDVYPAVRRYREIKSRFGFSGRAGMTYSNFGGVQVSAGVPYFVTYQNVDPNPRANFVSLNSPVVNEAAAGPNGRNTLDPDAPGAVAGLDPREAVAWSTDGGLSWGWGRHVGAGSVPGDYSGSGDDGVRLPWYAWQESGDGPLRSNQPYYAYSARGSYTLRVKSAPAATTLTQAGGYAPAGSSVGVVTVRNVRTGETGRTASLGSGLVKGTLTPPVEVAAGDTYEISNSGTVAKAEGDVFLQKMGLIGPGRSPYETVGNEYDRAELFALPHPWFAEASRPAPPAPEPPSDPAPEPPSEPAPDPQQTIPAPPVPPQSPPPVPDVLTPAPGTSPSGARPRKRRAVRRARAYRRACAARAARARRSRARTVRRACVRRAQRRIAKRA